jgi:hypothetical protein
LSDRETSELYSSSIIDWRCLIVKSRVGHLILWTERGAGGRWECEADIPMRDPGPDYILQAECGLRPPKCGEEMKVWAVLR